MVRAYGALCKVRVLRINLNSPSCTTFSTTVTTPGVAPSCDTVV